MRAECCAALRQGQCADCPYTIPTRPATWPTDDATPERNLENLANEIEREGVECVVYGMSHSELIQLNATIVQALRSACDLERQRNALQAKLTEREKDAERYRRLCQSQIIPRPSLWDTGIGFICDLPTLPRSGQINKQTLDAALDKEEG